METTRETVDTTQVAQTDGAADTANEVLAFPASYSQEQLWFLQQLAPDSCAYTIPVTVELNGPLDVAALETAFTTHLARYEVFRTRFKLHQGELVQVVDPAATFPLSVYDLAAEEDELAFFLQEELTRPFRLDQDLPVRARLLRLAPERHVLVLSFHHIAVDLTAVQTFGNELTRLYRASVRGQTLGLPEPELQYGDYAVWQRETLTDEALATKLAYWREALAGFSGVLALPTDAPRPAQRTFEGGSVNVALPLALSAELRRFSQSQGVSLYVTCLTVLKVLLHRYSAQDDIVVGTPFANRDAAGLESVMGCFINTLPLATDLSGTPSFAEALARVKQVLLGAHKHQDAPFSLIVDELNVKRDPGSSPLFQVTFTLQDEPLKIDLAGVSATPLGQHNGTAKFDLHLELSDTPEGLRGFLEYDRNLFNPDTVERFLGHFEMLLRAVVADSDTPIDAPSLLTPAEQRQLDRWNETAVSYPEHETVYSLFAKQVARVPDEPAVTYAGETLSYRELDARAERLAARLERVGCAPGTFVGLYVERSVEMLVGLLGILKAGGVYLPLDPAFPPERVAYMLEDSGTSLVVTQAHLQKDLPATVTPVCFEQDEFDKVDEARPHTAPQINPAPTDPAYIIYTSGSTGNPKGVLVPHRALTNFLLAMQRQPGLHEDDLLVAVTTLSFDIAALELFLPLISGAHLHVASRELATDAHALAEYLSSVGATVMQATPATWQMLVNAGWTGLETLKLLCGGEALSRELADALLVKGKSLWNLYGPTETTVWSAASQVGPGEGPVRIGPPIANTELFIVDRALNRQPVGVPGELLIGGAGVAQGYLERPELTAAKFISHPFRASGRVYRTGDLARFRPDGSVEFLGRLDFQVKLRGYRIELGEIEAALERHKHVKQAVVVAREDAAHKRLVAYLTPDGAAPLVDVLRTFLKRDLPEYMVPAAFMFLDAFPLTPNNKVDRRALPAPDGVRSSEASFVAARSEVEVALVQVWQDVLGVDRVGVHDNFFELGGDSLLAVQVVAKANRARLGLNARHLFQYQSVAELAAQVSADVASADQETVAGAVPLTPGLHRFLGERRSPDPHHWNIGVVFQARGRLESDLLQRALAHLLVHHDNLRSRFTVTAAGDWQHVTLANEADTPYTFADLTETPGAKQSRELESWANWAQGSLDLASGPLVRLVHFRFGGEPDRVLLVVHHFVVDALSWDVLVEDLAHLYETLSQDKPAQLPAKTTSFKRWAELLRARAHSDELLAERPYWLALPWQGVRRLSLDGPNLEKGNTNASARSFHLCLERTETQRLRQLGQPLGNLSDLVLSAVASALAEWTGSKNVLVDTLRHGRATLDGADVSRTAGFFIAYAPLVLTVEPDKPFVAAVKDVSEQLSRVPQGGVGHDLLRYLNRSHDAHAAFQAHRRAEVLFNYRGQQYDERSSEDALLHPTPHPAGQGHSPRGFRDHPIAVAADIVNGCLKLSVVYSANLHREATVSAFANTILRRLREL